MTLVLGLSTSLYSVLATDRLLTLKYPNRVREYDPNANKSVIFCAPDAIAMIGYAGRSYIEGVPTDQWLVAELTGDPYFKSKDGSRWDIFAPVARWNDIGTALYHLTRSLEQRRGIPSNLLPQLSVIGLKFKYRYNPDLRRPFAWELTADRRSRKYVRKDVLGEHWARGAVLNAVGDEPAARSALASDDLRAAALGTPKDGAEALARMIRRVAAKSDYVGPDCLTISLRHDTLSSDVRFHADAPQHVLAGSGHALEAAYSPWIIGRTLVKPPSLITGGVTVHLGPVAIELQAPEVPEDSSLRLSMSPHKRMPPR